MNCIGHVFEEKPQVAPSHPAHYTSPPRGSRLFRAEHGNAFARSLDGFEWVLLADIPVWCPTGRWFEEDVFGLGVMAVVPSFETMRNARWGG